MNRHLDISIRTITLAVVSAPFFLWVWLSIQIELAAPFNDGTCYPADADCHVDVLDMHTTP